jgi:hypothetical protein
MLLLKLCPVAIPGALPWSHNLSEWPYQVAAMNRHKIGLNCCHCRRNTVGIDLYDYQSARSRVGKRSGAVADTYSGSQPEVALRSVPVVIFVREQEIDPWIEAHPAPPPARLSSIQPSRIPTPPSCG